VVVLAAAAIAAALAARGGDPAPTLEPNSIGLIDPETNQLVAQARVGVRPTDIAVGRDAIWVINSDDRTLTELDPADLNARGTVPIGRRISSVAAAGERVWTVVEDRGSSVLQRIDPAFDVVAATRDLGRILRLPGYDPTIGAVAAAGGSLWAGGSSGDVLRLHPGTLRREAAAVTEGATRALAVAGDAVWAIVGDAVVVRIDRATGEIVERFTVATDAVAVAADPTAAWVASTHENVVTRIDQLSRSVTTVPVGRRPRDVAIGFGSVWVASADGTVTRIDPASRDVEARIGVGASIEGIAAGPRGVWVSGFAPLPRGS
jgi:hypothetical protein